MQQRVGMGRHRRQISPRGWHIRRCGWWFGLLPVRLAPEAARSRAHIHTDVLLGSERLSAVKTGVHQQPIFSGEAGLLGNGLLSQFRVTVDAGKSRLLLDHIQ